MAELARTEGCRLVLLAGVEESVVTLICKWEAIVFKNGSNKKSYTRFAGFFHFHDYVLSIVLFFLLDWFLKEWFVGF